MIGYIMHLHFFENDDWNFILLIRLMYKYEYIGSDFQGSFNDFT